MHEVPAGVAQLAEQPSCKRQVSGSIPLTGSRSVLEFEQPVGPPDARGATSAGLIDRSDSTALRPVQRTAVFLGFYCPARGHRV